MATNIEEWRGSDGRFREGNQYGSPGGKTSGELRAEVLEALRDMLPAEVIAEGMARLFLRSVANGSSRGVAFVVSYMIGPADVEPNSEGVEKMIEMLREYHAKQGPRTWADVD